MVKAKGTMRERRYLRIVPNIRLCFFIVARARRPSRVALSDGVSPCPRGLKPRAGLSQRRFMATVKWHLSNIKSLEMLCFSDLLHCSIMGGDLAAWGTWHRPPDSQRKT